MAKKSYYVNASPRDCGEGQKGVICPKGCNPMGLRQRTPDRRAGVWQVGQRTARRPLVPAARHRR